MSSPSSPLSTGITETTRFRNKTQRPTLDQDHLDEEEEKEHSKASKQESLLWIGASLVTLYLSDLYHVILYDDRVDWYVFSICFPSR